MGSGYTSATENHYLFHNQENHAFVKDIQEWYSKGYVTTSNFENGHVCPRFTNQEDGRCYMAISHSVGAKYWRPMIQEGGTYPFEVGVAMVPQRDVNNPKIYSEGHNLCILQKENPQEVIASWLFVKFLTTSKAFQADFSLKSAYMPVIKSVAEEPYYKECLAGADNGDGLQMLVMKLCIEQQEAYFSLPGFTNSNDVYLKVGQLLEEATRSNGDVESLFEKYMKAMSELAP